MPSQSRSKGQETWTRETITPEIAKKYLAKMAPNRKVSWNTVEQYAICVLNGLFQLTHEGVAFDKNGFLIDGQHRMHAIIRANKPLEQWVCRGVNRDSMKVVNTGHIRSAGQIAGFYNITNANRVMATSRAAIAGLSYPFSEIPKSAVLKCAMKHQEDIHWVISTIGDSIKVSSCIAAIMRASLQLGRQKLTYLLESIGNNTFASPYEPGNLLARTFTRQNIQGRRALAHEAAYGKTVTAIRMYLERKTDRNLKVSRADLWMPDFHHEFFSKLPIGVNENETAAA